MRKNKLQNPNFIVGSLDRAIYSTTDISIYCDAQGPNCNHDGVDHNDWKTLQGWYESHRYSDNGYHMCPECQKTNCKECGSEFEDSGRCPNDHCINHEKCHECGEPLMNTMYGDIGCINADCEINTRESNKREANKEKSYKLSSYHYWRSCDGPDCDSDGWDPEYERAPAGWHTIEHDRNGEHTTDYCSDCWDKFCHDCNEPLNENDFCDTPNCHSYHTCKQCGEKVNEQGHCLDPDDWCDRSQLCWYCDHKLYDHYCINNTCKTYKNPYDDFFINSNIKEAAKDKEIKKIIEAAEDRGWNYLGTNKQGHHRIEWPYAEGMDRVQVMGSNKGDPRMYKNIETRLRRIERAWPPPEDDTDVENDGDNDE